MSFNLAIFFLSEQNLAICPIHNWAEGFCPGFQRVELKPHTLKRKENLE